MSFSFTLTHPPYHVLKLPVHLVIFVTVSFLLACLMNQYNMRDDPKVFYLFDMLCSENLVTMDQGSYCLSLTWNLLLQIGTYDAL